MGQVCSRRDRDCGACGNLSQDKLKNIMHEFKVIAKFPFSPWFVGEFIRVDDPHQVLMSASTGYINLFNYPLIFEEVLT